MKRYIKKATVVFLIFSLIWIIEPAIGSGKKTTKRKPVTAKGSTAPIHSIKLSQILVKFKRGVKQSKRLNLFKKAGIVRSVRKLGRSNKGEIDLLQAKPDRPLSSIIKSLKASKLVQYAEPDSFMSVFLSPNDPYFNNQWSYFNNAQNVNGSSGTEDADIDADEAWDLENSAPINVAVIDTGIDPFHPDLNDKFWQNGRETDNGADDDRNGYVDDRIGYNWAGISQYAFNSGTELGMYTKSRAQSIKGRGPKLSYVGFVFKKVGNPDYDITVSLRNSASGNDLASFTISRNDVATDKAQQFYKQLNTSITLNNGTVYYLVATVTKTDQRNFYYIARNAKGLAEYKKNPYVDGKELYKSESGWHEQNDNDLYFKTNPISTVNDDNGHGTHVSGIVGAETNNGIGVAGTSQHARIMTLKAGASDGGFMMSDLVNAIYYAIGNDAKVINMSLGIANESAILKQAVQDANNAGVVVVAAVGNNGNATVNYPAGYDNVIGVGATNNMDLKANFSNMNNTVDFSAPGFDIFSTTPTYAVYLNNLGITTSYSYMNGTSMAAPMVAGLAAMIKSAHPNFSPDQISHALQFFAEDKGTAGKDTAFGFGRINANNSLIGDTTTPSATTITSSTHLSSSRYYTNPNPKFDLSATDNTALRDFSYTLDRSPATIPNSMIDSTLSSKIGYLYLAGGTWYLHAKAVDWFDNRGTESHYKINIDNTRPVTYAPYSAVVVKNQTADLYYRVVDSFSGGKATVYIIIKEGPAGQETMVKKLSLGIVDSNTTASYNWSTSLARGTYNFYVLATDQAGNVQSRIGSNRLKILAN